MAQLLFHCQMRGLAWVPVSVHYYYWLELALGEPVVGFECEKEA